MTRNTFIYVKLPSKHKIIKLKKNITILMNKTYKY